MSNVKKLEFFRKTKKVYFYGVKGENDNFTVA